MKRICLAVFYMAWLVVAAGVSLAQEPVPSLTLPNTEVYGGFVVTSPDYGSHWTDNLLHGFEAQVSKGFTEHLWGSGTFDFWWANPSVLGVEMHIKQVSLTVGPKYYFLTGKYRPYAIGQLGYARQSSNGFYAADHHPPLPLGTHTVEQGFTYRFGGGFEWQLKRKWYWRVVQWDWQPQPWGRHTPFYTNVGSGVGYRF